VTFFRVVTLTVRLEGGNRRIYVIAFGSSTSNLDLVTAGKCWLDVVHAAWLERAVCPMCLAERIVCRVKGWTRVVRSIGWLLLSSWSKVSGKRALWGRMTSPVVSGNHPNRGVCALDLAERQGQANSSIRIPTPQPVAGHGPLPFQQQSIPPVSVDLIPSASELGEVIQLCLAWH